MRKKMFVFMWMMVLSITSPGCWDIRYLDELGIVLAVAMDKGEDLPIQVTVQVVNPSQVSTGGGKSSGGGGGGGASPVTTYTETGQTVFEAIRKITTKSARRLYFAHNQLLVIGEDLARQGMAPLFEFIERDPEIRTDFYVVVAKGSKASDALKITTAIEKVPGTKIRGSIENVEKLLGTAYRVRVKDVVDNIGSKRKDLVTGTVEIVGDVEQGESNKNIAKIDPATLIRLDGMAVYKSSKLVDFLSFPESRGLTWIQNKIKNTVINVPCQSTTGNVAIEVIHSSTELKAKFQQGQPTIKIRVAQEANLGEIHCPEMSLLAINTFKQLQQEVKEQVSKEILAAVAKAKNRNADILGFSDAIYRVKPSYWRKNKDNWDNIFKNLPVQIEVDTQIRRDGTRNRSILERSKQNNKE